MEPSRTESKPTVHQITAKFNASIANGAAIETSAVQALQLCQVHNLKPTRELFNRESSLAKQCQS